ncbi:hypothetical protein OHB41_07775 [Streptomyces sp. NBC_01571]|uniref:hypothetical protein n=1 Tax=Streptomyces sp. NBC_01571 TaxID=2975883 RepID=UPI002258DDE6|nr:hypothetical protein [Streptomyces sp. NBC_01571]MCX4573084.1 hypothetical protein [Streptomyces sp. NBC_01571]
MTNQERMRALLDQRAQQAGRRSEQQHSKQANALARDMWWATRRSSKMRSRQRRCA